MNQFYQPPLPNYDPLIKLNVVEAELAKVIHPVPDRMTIYSWIEDGTLDGRQIGRGGNWYIFKSSLDALIIAMQPRQRLAA